jgi:hypothetical protein
MALRGVAGDMMNNPSTADSGRRLYAAVLSDMESGLVDSLPVGALQASEAMKAYRKLLGLARRQYEMNGSDLVKRLYPGGSPNVAKINQIAERIAQGVVDVPDIRLLKERVGAGFQGKTGIETQNILKGRSETIGLPKTERGEFLWDQVQQLYLDDLLMRHARNTNEPDKLALAGVQFYNKLFGTKKAKDVTQEIFGDVTPDLEAFANLVRDSGLSMRMFAGSPTQLLQEMSGVTSGGMRGITRTLSGLGAKYGGASQLAKSHMKGEGAMIGREFFQTGQLPNIQDWLHRHRKLAGATRLISQTAVRGFREDRSPDSQQR